MVWLVQGWQSPAEQLHSSAAEPSWHKTTSLVNRSIIDTPSTTTTTLATSSSSSSKYRGANAAEPSAWCQCKPRSLTQLHSKLSERNSEENTDLWLQCSQDQLRPLTTPGLNSLSPSRAVLEQDSPDWWLMYQYIAANCTVALFIPTSAFLE